MTIDALRGKPPGMSRLALGFPIVENKNMIIEQGTIVKRSWKERIFSLPWRPLQKTREGIHFVPDPDVYLIRDRNIIIAHPATVIILHQEIQKREEEK